MLDRQTIKTLLLIPEVDMEKAKKLRFVNKPEPQPDESTFGSQETACAAFAAVSIESRDTGLPKYWLGKKNS